MRDDIPVNEASAIGIPKRERRQANSHSLKNRFGAHRGFWYRRTVNAAHDCNHQIWWMFPLIPKRFTWTQTVPRLHMYIDAWYSGDRRTTAQYEKEGAAVDLEMPDITDPPLAKRIRTSASRLFSALALQDEFDVPLWGSTTFVTDGRYLVPATYINELIGADPKRFGHLDPKAKWVRAKDEHLKIMGIKPDQVTSGMYLSKGQQPAGQSQLVAEDEAPPEEVAAPPRERTVVRRDHDDFVEWITEVAPADGDVYYCRRVVYDRRFIYEATAWTRRGPWTVYHRDSSMLLALGVDL